MKTKKRYIVELTEAQIWHLNACINIVSLEEQINKRKIHKTTREAIDDAIDNGLKTIKQ